MNNQLDDGVQAYSDMHEGQLKYLKAWVMRTKSDAIVPGMEVQMMPNVINNLNELDKWLNALSAEVTTAASSDEPNVAEGGENALPQENKTNEE